MIPVDFIVQAKKACYAENQGLKITRDQAKQFSFEQDIHCYVDRYYGSNPFIGCERIFKNGRIIWGINYYGYCVGDIISPDEIFEFLKKALWQVPSTNPFRGPVEFTLEDFRYTNHFKGFISGFIGTESISYKGRVVYSGEYHGGPL